MEVRPPLRNDLWALNLRRDCPLVGNLRNMIWLIGFRDQFPLRPTAGYAYSQYGLWNSNRIHLSSRSSHIARFGLSDGSCWMTRAVRYSFIANFLWMTNWSRIHKLLFSKKIKLLEEIAIHIIALHSEHSHYWSDFWFYTKSSFVYDLRNFSWCANLGSWKITFICSSFARIRTSAAQFVLTMENKKLQVQKSKHFECHTKLPIINLHSSSHFCNFQQTLVC